MYYGNNSASNPENAPDNVYSHYWGKKHLLKTPGGTTHIIAKENSTVTVDGTPHVVSAESSYSFGGGGSSASPATHEVTSDKDVLIYTMNGADDMAYIPSANESGTLYYGFSPSALTISNVGSAQTTVTVTDLSDANDNSSFTLDPAQSWGSTTFDNDLVKVTSTEPLVLIAGTLEGTSPEARQSIPGFSDGLGRSSRRGTHFKGPLYQFNYDG